MCVEFSDIKSAKIKLISHQWHNSKSQNNISRANMITARVGMEASLSEIFCVVLKGLHSELYSTRDCFCYVTVPYLC